MTHSIRLSIVPRLQAFSRSFCYATAVIIFTSAVPEMSRGKFNNMKEQLRVHSNLNCQLFY